MRNYFVFLTIFFCFINATVSAKDKFNITLQKHLDAIQNRDFKSFEKTITGDSVITLILPNGKLMKSRAEYIEFMKEWFNETTWKMNYKIISKECSAGMGYALLLVNYDDISDDKKPYHIDYYLLLIFKEVNEEWYLVHDQNTGITTKEKKLPHSEE